MFNKILCPTDFSEPSFKAIEMALNLTLGSAAELCLLHVETDYNPLIAQGLMPAGQAARMRAEAVRNLCQVAQERTPVTIRTNTLLCQGEAAPEILRAAREQGIDLIILTSHGGGQRFEGLGRVAQSVLADAPCPVLVVNVPRAAQVHLPEGMGTLQLAPDFRPEFARVHGGRHALFLDND